MRSLAILLVASFFLLVANTEDCHAQLFGSRRTQSMRPKPFAPPILVQPPGLASYHVPQDYNAPTVFPTKDYYKPQSKLSRIIDGPLTYRYRNAAEVDSRYIGGFHQSSFDNIGIPSGDIGIRGNAYKWRTW
ncbi:hypothetical protein N9Y42_04140 [Mariniblastus sp.]|nr:hypothetical protein [Mariniblastus sp.]